MMKLTLGKMVQRTFSQAFMINGFVHSTCISSLSSVLAYRTALCSNVEYRMGPWMGDANGSIVRDKPKVREMYLNTKYKMDKYPYLYEGMNTIEEFRPYYCPMEILDEGHFLNCDDVESIDNGTLAERFTKFVMDYSGLDPFDIQLRMFDDHRGILVAVAVVIEVRVPCIRSHSASFIFSFLHFWLVVQQQFDTSGSKYSFPIR